MIDPNKVIQDGEQDDTIRQSLRAEITHLRDEVARLREAATLTDAEREALEWCAEAQRSGAKRADTLRALLARHEGAS